MNAHSLQPTRSPPSVSPMPAPASITELRDGIACDPTIPEKRRSELIGALGRFIALVPSGASMRPNGRIVGPALNRLHPVQTNLTAGTLASLRSLVWAALEWGYGRWPGAQYRQHLGPAWAARYALLPEDDINLRARLSRLAHWADREGIAPDNVDLVVIERFRTHLIDLGSVQNVRDAVRLTLAAYNRAQQKVPGWAAMPLVLPSDQRQLLAPPRERLNANFVADLDGYLASKTAGVAAVEDANGDISEDADGTPMVERGKRPRTSPVYSRNTLVQREYLLRRAAGLLAASGRVPLERIDALAVLVAPGNAAAIVNRLRVELGGRTSRHRQTLAIVLGAMAADYLRDGPAVERVSSLVRKAGRGLPKEGMTAKNRTRLEAIRDWETEALLFMPGRLMARAITAVRTGTHRIDHLVDAQVAVSVAILMHAPVRGENLGSIDLDEHLRLPLGRRDRLQEATLTFTAEEVKNSADLCFPLPADVVTIIRLYVEEIMPAFERTRGGSLLFPNLAGTGSKARGHLGTQISARIARECGIAMNPHLFRHWVGLLYLRENPSGHGVVQRLLGHRSITTTIRFYTGLELEAAASAYEAVVLRLKGRASMSGPLGLAAPLAQWLGKAGR